MIKIYQTKDVETHGIGNCFAACMASIFEVQLSDLPDIVPSTTGKDPDFYIRWMIWMKLIMDFSFTIRIGIDKIHQVYSIASGKILSLPNARHAVVCLNGQIMHDPFPNAIFRPVSELEAFVFFEKEIHKQDIPRFRELILSKQIKEISLHHGFNSIRLGSPII